MGLRSPAFYLRLADLFHPHQPFQEGSRASDPIQIAKKLLPQLVSRLFNLVVAEMFQIHRVIADELTNIRLLDEHRRCQFFCEFDLFTRTVHDLVPAEQNGAGHCLARDFLAEFRIDRVAIDLAQMRLAQIGQLTLETQIGHVRNQKARAFKLRPHAVLRLAELIVDIDHDIFLEESFIIALTSDQLLTQGSSSSVP